MTGKNNKRHKRFFLAQIGYMGVKYKQFSPKIIITAGVKQWLLSSLMKDEFIGIAGYFDAVEQEDINKQKG